MLGHAFIHSVLDDRCRVVYSEIHDDETAATATAVLRWAAAWFLARGVRIERALSDNGSCYRSLLWRDCCAELGIPHERTAPIGHRPPARSGVVRPLSGRPSG
jgi:transposase InsO family protein